MQMLKAHIRVERLGGALCALWRAVLKNYGLSTLAAKSEKDLGAHLLLESSADAKSEKNLGVQLLGEYGAMLISGLGGGARGGGCGSPSLPQ